MLPAGIPGHPLPCTESEYLALGVTACRIELLDGGLLVGPPPTVRHQMIAGSLATALEPGCAAAGHTLLPVINLRLDATRILNPDLVVTTELDIAAACVPASAVLLVGEITAPHTAVIDRLLKPHLYAAAGIEWYLLVELDTLTMHLHQRQGSHYVERSTTRAGEVLELTDPVRATIRPEDLLP
ncbi:Uma2 family endonuclease [Micromonospora acroterricola]|uniref:Uma2 family endonuclease n=1 Tax=Micromonospora acroterricola TaxID=2202421 RepID=A0A317CX54_9ACTN|nr:Uma2 family endonuclease [Micromonospora acroterricola]PWR06106.1 Uma2 family endonuclease [Micromonospora acroterricola]